MRTHRLGELALPGASSVLERIPDFDFYRLQRVDRLVVKATDDDADGGRIDIEATYSGDGVSSGVEITFRGVRRARMPEMIPSFFFSELEVEDVTKDQLEGIRYRAKDYGTEFEVLCADLEVRLIAHEPMAHGQQARGT